MKKLFNFTLFVILIFVLSACTININVPNVARGSGIITSEERQVSGYDQVTFNGAGELYIEQGTEEKLVIEAEDNVLPFITSEVKNGNLTLGIDTEFFKSKVIPTKPMVYRLTVIDLKGIEINGAADLQVKPLVSNEFVLNINGAGDMVFEDLQSAKLTVELDGGANVTVAGLVTEQTVVINGAGGYNAGDLQTSTTSITYNGASQSTVWVLDELDIVINGAGTVKYYGDPHVSQDISGVGDVKPLGNK